MNYIKHLAGFFDRVAVDERLNPSHISIYVSLFQFWNANRFRNPISIARSELMQVSKVSSKATYHKCLNDLSMYGYLRYLPSHNPMKGSMVHLFNFQTSTEQVPVQDRTKKRTSTEQVPGPFINSININKQENIVNGQKNDEEIKMLRPFDKLRINSAQRDTPPIPRERKEKSSAQKEKKNIPGSLEEVVEYFASRQYGANDAERYYNHFCSNGWLVGGKARMKDWKAAARNWMLNIKAYNNDPRPNLHPGNLHTTTAKDYSEPL